jgi:hypothetical protein
MCARSYGKDINAVILKAGFWSMLVSSFFLDTVWVKPFWLLWMMVTIYANMKKAAPDRSKEGFDE